MPFMLRFHDTDDTTEMPDPTQVGHAAAWAAERGYWDVATCLMELAHALADLERPVPAAKPANLPGSCSHGYQVTNGFHTATGGVCDDRPWCPAPLDLGGAIPLGGLGPADRP